VAGCSYIVLSDNHLWLWIPAFAGITPLRD